MRPAQAYKVNRNLGIHDSYARRPLAKDTILFECTRHTYGCIGHGGIAVTFDSDGDYPFFEINEEDVNPVDKV